jgi:hypothetical protein
MQPRAPTVSPPWLVIPTLYRENPASFGDRRHTTEERRASARRGFCRDALAMHREQCPAHNDCGTKSGGRQPAVGAVTQQLWRSCTDDRRAAPVRQLWCCRDKRVSETTAGLRRRLAVAVSASKLRSLTGAEQSAFADNGGDDTMPATVVWLGLALLSLVAQSPGVTVPATAGSPESAMGDEWPSWAMAANGRLTSPDASSLRAHACPAQPGVPPASVGLRVLVPASVSPGETVTCRIRAYNNSPVSGVSGRIALSAGFGCGVGGQRTAG